MDNSKKYYNDLLLSEERLKLVLEGSQQGFWDWNIEKGEVKRNDRWAQMLGYSTIKDFDDNTDTWTNSIHPEDRDAAWKSINDHLEGRTDQHKLEYRMLTKDGGYKWIQDHARIVQRDADGNPLRMSGTHIDISERKQKEEILLESEKRLHEVQRVGKIGAFTLNVVTGIWSGTDMLYQILGVEKKNEYTVKDWVEIIHPDHRERLAKYQLSILEKKIPFNQEYLVVRKLDGESRWVCSLGELQFDDSGNVIGMIGTTQDITDSKISQEQIKFSEERLRLSTTMAGIAVWEYDVNTKQMSRSDNYDALFGLDHQVKWNIDELLNATHPDDREDSQKIIQQAIQPNGSDDYSFDFRIIWPDNSLHWLTIIGRVTERDSNGIGIFIRGCLFDISNRKQAEHNFLESEKHNRVLVENAPYCIHEIDLQGRLISMNSVGLKMMGVHTEQNIIGTDYLDTCSEEDKPRLNKLMLAAFNGQQSMFEFKAANDRYFSSSFTPIFDNNGKVRCLMGITDDITERKANEEVLRRTQKMDALGKLTGGVAHDFNNILSIIVGYSDLLKEMLHDQPSLARYAYEIEHAGNRGSKLTNKLLGFSRKRSSNSGKLNLNTLLRDQQHMLEKTLTVRIQLEFDLADDLWITWLDSSDLEDAIINLSINAMYAIEGNGKLVIKTNNEKVDSLDAKRLGLEPGDYVLLTIADTGVGMDESTKEKIFEPFFTTKAEEGTGLGLSQVYGFIKRSLGTIKVTSELGLGTSLELYFPRHIESGNEEQSPKKQGNSDFKGTETILIVDDEHTLLELTREVLIQQGYKVICAQNGKKALEILAAEPVNLLLTDVIMPEMDGYQLAKITQEKYPQVKIQLASGFGDNHHQKLVDPALRENMLNKPFSSITLLKKVRMLLDANQSINKLIFDV